MKHIVALLALLSFTADGEAGAPWFLPREPEADTLVYVAFEDEAVKGAAGGELALMDGAERAAGRFGRGLRLSRGKQHVRINSTAAVQFGRQDPFTVEMWVRPADRRGGALWSLATRYYLHIGSKAQFGYRAASFPIRYTGLHTLRLPPRRWSHVALTHDTDRTVRIYINGEKVEVLQHDDEGDFAKSGTRLVVGSHDGWTKYLRADIDEVRISRGVRVFRPLLSQDVLMAGESAQLSSTPSGVDGAILSVRQGRQVIREAKLTREQLAGDLIPVSALPAGKATLSLTFLAGDGAELSTASAVVENAAGRMADVGQRLEALRRTAAASGEEPWRKVLGLYAQSIDERVRDRKLDQAEERLRAAEVVSHTITSGEAAYRAQLRAHVRARKLPDDIRITVSWRREPDGAFAWAERLGANELVGHTNMTVEQFQSWKQRGYHTVLLKGIPIHDHDWLREHPANRQIGFWVSKPVKATETTVAIPFGPPTWGSYHVDRREIKRWWKVVDSHNQAVPPERWTLDPKQPVVTVAGATSGESYRVYYRFQATTFLDPLAPGSRERAANHITEVLGPLRGVLDTFWADDIAYGWPGRTEQGGYDWESYTLAAGPTQIAAFEKQTGIAFDPVWLVCPPRTIDSVPDPRYLKWMTWVRDQLKPFIAAHCKTLSALGMRSWVYWGDCHVGMEPYGGSLAAFDEVDKPSADPVTVRALSDFPGATYRRMRTDWIFGPTGRDPRMPARHWQKWHRPRRGLLRNPKVQGIYWMVFDHIASSPDADVRENLVEVLASINDEFRLLNVDIGKVDAFTHDLDVIVLSVWGDNYAWRPWGNRVLWHLTDLPVRVRFESFLSVAEGGLPEETDVVFLYGRPNTAWSGGRYWADGKVSTALRTFVREGGGLVALQAPSALDGKWIISDLLGVEPAGAIGPAPIRVNPSELADVAEEGEELPPGSEGLRLTKAGAQHWLARSLPTLIPGLRDTAPVRVIAEDAALLATRVGAKDREGTPGAVARSLDRGRVVYACGNSSDDTFGRFLRHAVFWSAHREADADRLDVSPIGLFAYAYPSKRLIAVHNSHAESVEAVLRCDPAIFGRQPTRPVVLRDVVLGTEIQTTGAALADGVKVVPPPNGVGLWRVGE